MKAILNAIVIWLNPQTGLINTLKRKVHIQSVAIEHLKSKVRSEIAENEKLRLRIEILSTEDYR